MASDRTQMTSPSWLEYFEEKHANGVCGDLSAFEDLPPSYCDDVSMLKQSMLENEGNVIFVIPDSSGLLRPLHNCFPDFDHSTVIGISGTRTYSPFKQLPMRSLAKPMVIPGTDQKTNIPSRDDFLECDTHQEVKALVGTGDRRVVLLLDPPPPDVCLLHHTENRGIPSCRSNSTREEHRPR
jgi:hypothetical protein